MGPRLRRSVNRSALLGVLGGFILGAGWARSGKGEQEMTGPSWKVTGVGGVFFKARDPEALKAWYQKHLRLEPNEYGTILFWSTDSESQDPVYTVWGPFPEDTEYFQPSTKPFMFNLRDRRNHRSRMSGSGRKGWFDGVWSSSGKFGRDGKALEKGQACGVPS